MKEIEKMTYLVSTVNHMDEINWNEIDKAEISHFCWGDPQVIDCYGQLVYVKGYGLICHMAAKEEPEIKYLADADPVYQDCALEFFLQLGEEGYINCETNAAGARLQEFGKCNTGRKMIVSTEKNFACLAGIEGDYWSVTIQLPLETLRAYYPTLSEKNFDGGETFRGNFYKIHDTAVLETSHFGMWQEIDNDFPQFHIPAQFGTFIMA